MADTIPEPARRPTQPKEATPTPAPDTPTESGTVVEVNPRLDLLAGPPPPLTELHVPMFKATESPLMVPGYAVHGELARGGMGVVYAAHDLGLNREVAIKTLLPGYAEEPRVIARFVREAQITARLPHPGVPPVHAQRELPDGRPFLAMKLIRGRTLADILANPAPASGGRQPPVSSEQQGADAPRSPSHADLLAIFEAVCQTVGFAHSVGVIHRDLKPANVMVGAFGEVQVMDWGLAKVLGERPGVSRPSDPTTDGSAAPQSGSRADTDSSEDTLTGYAMGTPAYMPPEQATGDWDRVDYRADVFALGSVLCAVLTGKPTYTGKLGGELMARAKAGNLTDTFARLDACGADAELVALAKRCLAPDPADRPADAGEVAKAVADYRTGVEARAKQAELDLVRAEGEKVAAEAKAAEALRRVEAEEQATLALVAKAAEQRKRRKVQLALAGALGLLLFGGGTFLWWQDKKATAESNRRTRNGEAITSLVGGCENALKAEDAETAHTALIEINRRLPEGGGESSADRLTKCRADLSLLRELNSIDEKTMTLAEGKAPFREVAGTMFAGAFTPYGIIPGTTPVDEAARRIRESHLTNRILSALDVWLAASQPTGVLALLQTADPDEFRTTMRYAVKNRDGDRVAELAGRPEALTQPAWFIAVLSQRATIPRNRRIQLATSALGRQPGDFALLITLGSYIYRMDGPQFIVEGEKWLRAAVAARPRNPVALNNLAVVLHDKKDFDGAIVYYREAIRLAPRYAAGYSNLGNALKATGDVKGAFENYRKAIDIDPTFANAHYNLGVILDEQKRPAEAIACYREALRHNPDLAPAHFNLGNAWRTSDPAGAIAEYREAIRIDPKLTPAFFNLGLTLYYNLRFDEAIAAFETAIQLDPKDAQAHLNLGNARGAKGDLVGAIADYHTSIRLNPNIPQPHYQLAWFLAAAQDDQLRDGPAAVKHAQRGGELSGWRDPDYVDVLGMAYAEVGEFDKAIECQKKALAVPEFEKEKGADARRRLALYEQKKPFRDPELVNRPQRDIAPPPREVKR